MLFSEKLICSLALSASIILAQGSAGLVRLSATVLDAAGEPVEDLKVSDFQVTDQGKAQKIDFFGHNPEPMLGGPLAPNEHSNLIKASPHATAILFDLLNENQSDRLSTWHLLAKSIPQMEAADSVYFYYLSLEGELTPIHAIGKGAQDDKTWTKTFEKDLDKAMKGAMHGVPTQMKDQEAVVKKTYVAMEKLAGQMIVFPGRRDIVWVTSSMPSVYNTKNPCGGDWVDCALYVPHLAVTLSSENVAVNPVMYTSSPDPNMSRDLEQMSGLTGGWTYSGEDIRSVVKEVTRDAAHNYSIYYDPSNDNWDSKFHKVHVALERKGVKLRVKQRYYAFPDRRADAAKQQPVLAAAFQSPFDDPSIGLRAMLSGGKVQFKVDPSDLLLTEQGGTYTGGITFLIADMGAAGPTGDPMLSNLPLTLTKEQYAAAMKDGIPMEQAHAVNDSIKGLRVIVLDHGLNVAGSLTIPAH
jgi:VWFA-related protein